MSFSQSFNLNTLVTTYQGQDPQGDTTELNQAAQLADMAFNIRNYQAKLDGVADDSNAIQIAINAMPNNATLVIPYGSLLWNQSITISKPIRILSFATIKHTTSVPFLILDSLTVGDIVLDGLNLDGQHNLSTLLSYTNTGSRTANVYVRNCTFKNAGTNGYAEGHTGSYIGAYIMYMNKIVIENCLFDTIEYFGAAANQSNEVIMKHNRFNNCGVYGMTCNESDKCVYLDNYIYNCGSGGFDAERTDYTTNSCKITWIGNVVENCGNDDNTWGGGIVAGNGCYGIIQGNTIKNLNLVNKKVYIYAIDTNRNTDLIIDGNMVIGSGSNGIYIQSDTSTAYRMSVTNNYISDCVLEGISAYGSSNLSIVGNTIQNGQIEGIYVNQCNYVNVVGNKIVDNSKAGVNLYSGVKVRGCNNANVSSNTITGTHKNAIEWKDDTNISGSTVKGNSWNGASSFCNFTGGGKVTDWEAVHGIRTCLGSGIPTGDFWFAGERIINSSPVVGQPKAWVCTVGGTSGTWVSEGNL